MADRASTSNPMRGILFMVVAMLIFSVQDGLSKQLASTHSPIFITMIRYWFFGAVVLVILYRKGVRLGLSSGHIQHSCSADESRGLHRVSIRTARCHHRGSAVHAMCGRAICRR